MCVCLGNRKPSTGNEHEQCFICSVSCRAFFHYIQLCFSFFFHYFVGHLFTNEQYLWPLFERERIAGGQNICLFPCGGARLPSQKKHGNDLFILFIILWFYFGFMRLAYQQSIMNHKLCPAGNQKWVCSINNSNLPAIMGCRMSLSRDMFSMVAESVN